MVQALLEDGLVHNPQVLKPAYSHLLVELSYALVGITGDVFVDPFDAADSGKVIRHPSRPTFRINPEVDWLSQCDKKQIEGILALGWHYHEIDRFIEHNNNKRGLCWYGLRVGLQELCFVYRAAVLRVERHVLADQAATITSIQHFLAEFVTVLPGVHAVLYEMINIPNRSDAAVMSLLYDRTCCGKPSLEAVLERILWNCNQVLYRHLSAWLFHGLLLDSDFEFFVTCLDTTESSAMSSPHPSIGNDDIVANSWSSLQLQVCPTTSGLSFIPAVELFKVPIPTDENKFLA